MCWVSAKSSCSSQHHKLQQELLHPCMVLVPSAVPTILHQNWIHKERMTKVTCTLYFPRVTLTLINRAAVGWAVLARPSVYFFFQCFLVLSVTIPEHLRMMSSSANYRPFLSSFRHIPPQESFVKLVN